MSSQEFWLVARSKIPQRTESLLMFDNEHTCCICNEKGKDVQIHHIDGNHNNNNVENLVVLCLDCHSKVTGNRGLGKKFSELEVRQYKKNWEFRVKKKRGLILKSRVKPSATDNQLTNFELRKNVYELTATRSLTRVKEILEVLTLYYIYEDKTSYILTLLHNFTPLLCAGKKGILISQAITHYFGHLPGPEYNKITKKDIKNLKDAIDLLSWIGEFESEFVEETKVAKICIRELYELFEIVKDYKINELQNRIITKIKNIRKIVVDNYKEQDVKRTSCIKKVDYYLNKIKSEKQN